MLLRGQSPRPTPMTWTSADIPDQSGRTVVVTGANGGLGLETSRALAGAGAHVVMAARNQDKASAAVADIRGGLPDASLEVVALDLGSLASVREASEQILGAHQVIDVLVNNAGVMGIPARRTVDGFEMQLGVDHLGHWALTALLMPGLLRVLEGAGAPAGSLIAHPGLCNTELQAVSVRETGGGLSQRFWHVLARRTGMVPSDGARSQLRAATDPGARSGEFYGPAFVTHGPPVRKPILRRAGMGKAISRLWQVSERETGLGIDVDSASVKPEPSGG